MKILLDTHFLLWVVEGSGRLTNRERRVLERSGHSTFVSVVSFWEMRIKWNKFDRRGRRKSAIDPKVLLASTEAGGLIVVPLTAEVAIASLNVAVSNADPFDELLMIHAQELGARLLTRDTRLLEHPLALQP